MATEIIHNNHETAKHFVDLISMATVIGTIAEYLPAVAALFSIVWTIIRIYETKTVQKLLRRKDKDD